MAAISASFYSEVTILNKFMILKTHFSTQRMVSVRSSIPDSPKRSQRHHENWNDTFNWSHHWMTGVIRGVVGLEDYVESWKVKNKLDYIWMGSHVNSEILWRWDCIFLAYPVIQNPRE